MLESAHMLVDTHAHLTMPELARDLPGVLERAGASGVGSIVCVGVDLASSRRTAEMAERHPELVAAVGVHPNDCADLPSDWIEDLRSLAVLPRVVAIGEIGLDYYRQNTPRDLQRTVFERQLELAAELSLPVIVHNRASDADVTATLAEWSLGLPAAHPRGVLHCFSSGRAVLDAVLAGGFRVSFAGPVTYPNGKLAAEMAAATPGDRLLLETDSPYLAPHPHRGKRNEPAMVRLIAERVAELRGESIEQTIARTSENALHLFGSAIGAGPGE